MATDKMNIKVKVDGADKAQGDLKGVDSSIGSMVKSIALATAAMVAMKKSFDFMKGSADLAMQQEEIFVKL